MVRELGVLDYENKIFYILLPYGYWNSLMSV